MVGRYKSRAYPSRYGPRYNDRTDAPIDAPMNDNVDTAAPSDLPTDTPMLSAPSTKGEANTATAGDSAEGDEGEAETRGKSSSASIQPRGEYLSRRRGESPISERTRAAVLSRVAPIAVLSHIARGQPMLTTWTDPKSGKTKDIWVRPTVDQRLRAAEIGLDRVAPRLRAIEVSGEQALSYRLTIDDMRGLLAQADPVTREIAEAEYEELTGETHDNESSRESGEQATDESDGRP